jgi:hypothetical protein
LGLDRLKPTTETAEEHIVLVPIVLGRGVQLWDGFEELEQRFDVESVSSPSGVIHLTFGRP